MCVLLGRQADAGKYYWLLHRLDQATKLLLYGIFLPASPSNGRLGHPLGNNGLVWVNENYLTAEPTTHLMAFSLSVVDEVIE